MAIANSIVKFKYGSREQFEKLNVITQKVEMYLDNNGCFYVVPVKEEESVQKFELELIGSEDNPFI